MRQCSPMCTPSMSRPTRSRLVERGGLPRRQLRRRLRHEAATHRALARAPASHRRRHRLQAARIPPRGDAHQHLLDHAPIQRVDIGHRLERRQRHLAAPPARTRGRRTATFRPPSTTSLLHRAGARGAGGRPRCAYRGPQMAVRSSSSIVVQHLQPRTDGELEQLGPGIDEQIDQREVVEEIQQRQGA